MNQVRILACLLLLCLRTGTAFAVPPPPVQVTADCENSTYASDFLVCSDAALMELDRFLARQIASQGVLPAPADQAEGGAERETDQEWFRRSRMCAFETDQRNCLLDAYCARISLLEGYAADLPPEVERPYPSLDGARICPVE